MINSPSRWRYLRSKIPYRTPISISRRIRSPHPPTIGGTILQSRTYTITSIRCCSINHITTKPIGGHLHIILLVDRADDDQLNVGCSTTPLASSEGDDKLYLSRWRYLRSKIPYRTPISISRRIRSPHSANYRWYHTPAEPIL